MGTLLSISRMPDPVVVLDDMAPPQLIGFRPSILVPARSQPDGAVQADGLAVEIGRGHDEGDYTGKLSG